MSTVFIVKLCTDHRAAVLPLQPLHLSEDLPIKALHIFQEQRILGARLATFGEQPVWYAATTHLSMTERP